MTTPDTTSTLTTEQQQRADALRKARGVLTAKGFMSDGGASAIDLIQVAGWILDGQDPRADDTDRAATFRSAIHDATDIAVDQLADAIGVDPDAPLPDNTDCTCMWCTETPADHDDEDDDQIGSVRG